MNAPCLGAAAIAAVASAARGETDARRLEAVGLAQLDGAGVTVDYLALVDGSSRPCSPCAVARGF